MVIIRSIFAYSFTIISVFALIPFGFPAFILSFFGLKKPMSWVIYRVVQFWARGIIFFAGCKMTVEGRENIPKKGGVCFVCNHIGVFDIVVALAYAGRPFGFIAKKELLYFPFFNLWIHMLGGLFIDRKNIRKAIKTINHGIKKIQNGFSMLVFPEGTRSRGRGLLPFRSGAVKLATQSLAPIVPMAISGSYDVFEVDYRVHVVPVKLVFCPPIITADMDPDQRRHRLADEVRGIIEAALVKL
ncbi:MAG: 1-acyl-sn-glycerol-3-phosphate acyltransferase [Treponema sp.]|nr:1-acyl-sn-glycerol-3-phosphate acyltransferase [Treponema sp.]